MYQTSDRIGTEQGPTAHGTFAFCLMLCGFAGRRSAHHHLKPPLSGRLTFTNVRSTACCCVFSLPWGSGEWWYLCLAGKVRESVQGPILTCYRAAKLVVIHLHHGKRKKKIETNVSLSRGSTRPIAHWTGLVAKNLVKWYCSKFRCYLTISVPSWST
jgi:hypothetical protein